MFTMAKDWGRLCLYIQGARQASLLMQGLIKVTYW